MQRGQDDMNVRGADMWSFAVLLWEIATREVPFAGLSPMEIGMKVGQRWHQEVVTVSAVTMGVSGDGISMLVEIILIHIEKYP